MIKKLKSRAGLTLTELLVTTLILTMFSSACLVGITTAISVRRDSIMIADADVLKATVTQLISSELRLCTKGSGVKDAVTGEVKSEDVKLEDEDGRIIYGGGLSIDNKSHGMSELWLSTADDVSAGKAENEGYLMKKIGNIDLKYQLLAESAYTNMRLDNLKFEFVDASGAVDDEQRGWIKVTFDVCEMGEDGSAGRVITSADFTVKPINDISKNETSP